jgi:hypothetical protein
MTWQWNIIDTGDGRYNIKSCHGEVYIGHESDVQDGGKTMMSNLPCSWAVISLSNGLYQWGFHTYFFHTDVYRGYTGS